MRTLKLLTFKQYLLEVNTIDSQLDDTRTQIALTKKRIIYKQLQRALKILKDKERSTSSATGFVK